ncbi:MAG: hypothetical protein PHE29_12765 [Tissierellia bacterium]|nr:hypothetical protein [Tissierellia bacterium]
MTIQNGLKLGKDLFNMDNIKWYVTTILMPDNILYVGITESDFGTDITISEHDTEEEADEACRQYSIENNIPLFEEYREDV